MFWGFGAVLGSAKQRLYADVVAGDARAGAEGPYAEAGDHGRCGGGLLRGVIVAMECGFLVRPWIPSAKAARRARCAA